MEYNEYTPKELFERLTNKLIPLIDRYNERDKTDALSAQYLIGRIGATIDVIEELTKYKIITEIDKTIDYVYYEEPISRKLLYRVVNTTEGY